MLPHPVRVSPNITVARGSTAKQATRVEAGSCCTSGRQGHSAIAACITAMTSQLVSPFRLHLSRASRRTLCSSTNKSLQPPPAKIDSQQGVLQFIDSGTSAGATRTGRSWRTSELRLKSYDDLHKLWFILLKERNILLTEKAWCKTNRRHWVNGPSNLYKVKRSMARLKGVIGERIRAYKAKRAREALQAEQNTVGLGDAMSQPHVERSGITSRTTPPSL